jgi:hypothetical protein
VVVVAVVVAGLLLTSWVLRAARTVAGSGVEAAPRVRVRAGRVGAAVGVVVGVVLVMGAAVVAFEAVVVVVAL